MKKMFAKITAGIVSAAMLCGIGFVSAKVAKNNAAQVNADNEWSRVTAVSDLTSGGTFIFGYETTANSGVLTPMINTGATATLSTAGYIASGSSIDMSTIDDTTGYEFSVVPSTMVSGAICIKYGDNYIGNENTKNNCKLYAEQSAFTSFTPTIGDNDVFALKITGNASYHTLQYNTGSPRFAVYGGTQKNVVIYKKSINTSLPAINLSTTSNSIRVDSSTATITGTSNDSVLNGMTFVSSNSLIATVNDSGVVTPVSPGQVTITASKDGYVSGSIQITILPTIKKDTCPVTVGSEYVAKHTVSSGDYYFTGEMNGYYGATSNNINSAQRVMVEENLDGVAFSFTKNDVKKYISISDDGSHINFEIVNEKPSPFYWNNTYLTFRMEINGVSYFIGTNVSHDTMSAAKWDSNINSSSYSKLSLVNPPAEVTIESITAVLNAASLSKNWSVGDIVTENDIIVTAHYSDGTSGVIESFTISNNLLVEGRNEIVVSLDNSSITTTVVVQTTSIPTLTTNSFKKLTSSSEFGDGHYLIGNSDGTMVMKNTDSASNNNRKAVESSVSNGYVLKTTEMMDVYIREVTNGVYTLYACDGAAQGFLNASGSGSSNYLKIVSNNNSKGLFSITFDGEIVSIVSTDDSCNGILKYNSTSSLFACYGSGESELCLFKPADPMIAVSSKTLEGKSGESEMVSVTAYGFNPISYLWSSSDESVATVYDNVANPNVFFGQVGSATLTVTVSDGSIIKTETISVTVSENSIPSVSSGWTKVTDLSNVSDGTYALVPDPKGNSSLNAFNWVINSNKHAETSSFDPSEYDSTFEVTIKNESGYITLQNPADNKYLGASANKSGSLVLYSSVGANTKWQIKIGANDTSGTCYFKQTAASSPATLRGYNSTALRSYGNENGTGIFLYKKAGASARDNFANAILNLITCSNGVSMPSLSEWNSVKTNYFDSKLTSADITFFQQVNVEGWSNSTYSQLTIYEKAMAKYDLIVIKYNSNGFVDYLNRNPQGAPIIKSLMDDASGVTTIVTVTAIASITLVGGFTLTRKRKHF